MNDTHASERINSGWRDIVIVTALVVLVGVPSLFTRDLWNPDEPRYMEVAREMVVLGDYVIPHLNGKVYSEKPPMFFWLAGLLWRAGMGYNSGRLVTLAAVWGTLLLVYLFCRRLIGPRAGLFAAAIALTCVLLAKFTTLGVIDPLLMFFMTAALLAGYDALHCTSGQSALPLWLACYVAMGLGTLTKGPVGIVVPGLILAVYGIANRRDIRLGGAEHAVGFAVLAVMVLAWLIPATRAGGLDYTRTILLKQNIGRMVNSFSHRQPFYYYLVQWPVYFFPWSFILPLAVFAAVRRWRESNYLARFAFLWLIVPFTFFTLASGKRMNYILPITPAVGILVAWYFTSSTMRHPRADRWLLSIASCCVALYTVLLMTTAVDAPTIVRKLVPEADFAQEIALPPSLMVAALATLVVPLVVSLWGAFSSRASNLHKATALIVAMVLACLAPDIFFLPAINKIKSGKPFGMTINRYATDDKTLYLYESTFSGVYNLWTGRVSIPELETQDELREKLADPNSLIVSDMRHFGKVLTPREIEFYRLAQAVVGHRVVTLLAGKAGNAGITEPASQADTMQRK
jgi:4-amino-4-deoxy-L-arabinose transferase-like glycosyltransferase